MKECIERVVLIIFALFDHLTIGIDAMFQTVSNQTTVTGFNGEMLSSALLQFPACIANLNASLTHVNTDALTLKAGISRVKTTRQNTVGRLYHWSVIGRRENDRRRKESDE